MLKYLVLTLALLATSALAQQQAVPPPETALQINGVIGQWAQTLVQQARVIEDLQKQLAAAHARVKELEPKQEPAKK